MSAPEAVDSSTIAEMEETVARISSHKGVEGVMIMDRRGAIDVNDVFHYANIELLSLFYCSTNL